VYCYPVDSADELKQSDCSSSQSSLLLDSIAGADGDGVTDGLQSGMAETDPSCDSDDSAAMESFDDFEDFCIIDEPGLGIMVSSYFICSASSLHLHLNLEMQCCHVFLYSSIFPCWQMQYSDLCSVDIA